MPVSVGLDFVIIDQEHGPGGVQSAIDMMRALSGSTTTAMIRVPSSDPTYLKRIVDAGAQAILVPMVDSAAEAKTIVDACRYPPLGRRGHAAGVVRGARYGLSTDYLQTAHESLLIVPQIETVTAVHNAREIASVDGVDMVFIGPSDLSGSAGHVDQTGAPEVERLIAETGRRFGRPASRWRPSRATARAGRTLFADGLRCVASGSDIAIFRSAAATSGAGMARLPQTHVERSPHDRLAADRPGVTRTVSARAGSR